MPSEIQLPLFPDLLFPDPRLADADGLVAIGGDFMPETLVAAYAAGIFPWPHEDLTHAWFSPDPRFVLPPARLHVARSLRKAMRRGDFEVRYDTVFEQVMRGCAGVPRTRQPGTWIVEEMIVGYVELHRLGLAHSVESWSGGELVGGLYGVSLGGMFFGESMFQRRTDASKIAFVHLVERLRGWGFDLVDCQVRTEHLARFGALDWPRSAFCAGCALAGTADAG
ncbi:MAG: leucyl/phenylalanyl-tRNA--protein transferase, partial [Thermoanaerobaculia bacterium]|nr:leucyl/phenylalanyl-tRNA--protein transferase [Thermoanaerobaculia bacterium]